MFDPGAQEELSGRARALLGSGLGGDVSPEQVVVAALRAMKLQQESVVQAMRDVSTAKVVATLPDARVPSVPTTRSAVDALLSGCKRELLVVGYLLEDRAFLESVEDLCACGREVTIVGERAKGLFRLYRNWKVTIPSPKFLTAVEPVPGAEFILHAKVVVVDRSEALVGSANFTMPGFRRNFEVGVRLSGKRAAEDIYRLIAELTRRHILVHPDAPP